MEESREFAPQRRRCLRQMVHAPAFASFDGVSGGMILDLSEEGLSMQMGHALDVPSRDGKNIDKGRPVRVELDLSPSGHVETTGYIAWADALGRAGVRFSDLPEAARRRLNEWLMVNAGAPSHTAPKVALGWARAAAATLDGREDRDHVAISLEAETGAGENGWGNGNGRQASATVQYEFS